MEKKDYQNAANAYAIYAKQVNWLANLITAGLEPFYGAKYDDRKSFYPRILSYSDLTAAENKANEYKGERNRAMLYEGLCYYNMDEYETALPLLIKALDLIEIKDEANWKLGMESLYTIIGYRDVKTIEDVNVAEEAIEDIADVASVAGLKSGEYTETAQGMGGPVSVTLIVKDGILVDVSIVGDSETQGIGSVAIEECAEQLKEAGSAVIDGVSGATVTSNAIKEAASAAFRKASM